jgi:hypothetical protein
METHPGELDITYFPHTLMEENNLKRLILYFSNVRLLQVLPDFAPGLPDPLPPSSMVQSFCPLSSSLIETIRRAYQTYHQLGRVHQDGGLVQLLRNYVLQEEFEDSRTGLVAHIRKGLSSPDPEEAELVNDAVFLLFAHELEREHLELDRQLERIRRQETKFHKEVGIGSDEEMDDSAIQLPLLAESDHPRTQYPFQRFRAWTRLYCSRERSTPFLPLTTSVEVLGEIFERLPTQLAGLSDESPATSPVQHRLSILPDPQTLSLEEVLEFRESLSRKGILNDWWESAAAAIKRLRQESLAEEQWRDLQEHLQKAADEFHQHWPTSDKPAQHLRLESISFPGVQPDLAFILTAGLQPPGAELPITEGRNGITLLLSPAALPQDDRL